MTDREAIEFLKNMIDREPFMTANEQYARYHVTALSMAIKALEEKIRMEDDGK